MGLNYAFPYRSKGDRRTGINKTIRFWENTAVSEEKLKTEFWGFCVSNKGKSRIAATYVQSGISQIRNEILDDADKLLSSKVKDSEPRIQTKNASVQWYAPDWRTAEYMSLYAMLMSEVPFRVCAMCKAVFQVDKKHPNRRYCPNHKPKEIEYYRTVLNKMAKQNAETEDNTMA